MKDFILISLAPADGNCLGLSVNNRPSKPQAFVLVLRSGPGSQIHSTMRNREHLCQAYREENLFRDSYKNFRTGQWSRSREHLVIFLDTGIEYTMHKRYGMDAPFMTARHVSLRNWSA